MRRRLFEQEHEDFRSAFRAFVDSEAVPKSADWEEAGFVEKEFWRKAGDAGFLGFEASPEFGGLGVSDFRFNAVIGEEVAASGMVGDGFALHNDIVAPYVIDYASDEQRQRWVPGFVSGETVTAIAMSEPGAGSDLARISTRATIEDDTIVLNGSKTFITNGFTADLALVLARTGEDDGKGMSLIAVEAGTPGFTKGKPLKKIGRRAQDTGEFFFDDCRVPMVNLIGEPGAAFDLVKRNLPRERLTIAVTAVASARRALDLALAHADERHTFGKPLRAHQTVLHKLATWHTSIQVLQSHVDACIVALNDGELTPEDAAGVKYYATDLEGSVIDDVLQLFGGYGYMEEYPIARMWRDARIQRIYGGANEILKEIVGRGLFA
jgi:acyl-CoA dehydrogenase